MDMTRREGHMAIHIRRRTIISTLLSGARLRSDGHPCGQEAPIDLRQTEPSPRSLVRFIENCGREHDMSGLKWLMIAGLIAGFAGAAQAEDFDIGKSEFQSSWRAAMVQMEKAKDLSASSSRYCLPI